MRLVCPKCASEYEVDGSLFPEEGREVQCSSCEEVWVQYNVPAEPPMRLDARTAVAASVPKRPSERLDEKERGTLASAVLEEIDARERNTTFVDDATANDDIDDDEIVAALRQQIKAEGGGDFSKTGQAKSQKRNLRVAAEAVGVDVDVVEDDSAKRKWNLSSHDDDRNKAASGGRRDGLKEALSRYEEEVGPTRRRSGVRKGFMAAVVLVILGAGVFIGRDQIVEAYPPAEPYLDQYAGYVEQGRAQAETLYAEWAPVVMAKIDEFTNGDAGEAQ